MIMSLIMILTLWLYLFSEATVEISRNKTNKFQPNAGLSGDKKCIEINQQLSEWLEKEKLSMWN